MVLFISLSIIVLLIATVLIYINTASQIGDGKKITQAKQQSSQFYEGKFINSVTTNMKMSMSEGIEVMKEFAKKGLNRSPNSVLRTQKINNYRFDKQNDTELSITWLGHSTVLIKIDGKVIITDPVFSKRASMVQSIGPKQFNYSQAFSVAELPEIDIILLSHDHYDHLDYNTILQIHKHVKKIYVPIGVKEHLIKWGVEKNKVIELDWWQENSFDTSLQIVCTPARHFSGRTLGDRDMTLWSSWTIIGSSKRVFFSGDSGYFDGFKTIGDKYGPFDLTLIECGQYNERWPDIHMMPEQSVQANIDLRGKIMIPIHWGKFSLSLHSWLDPVERAIKQSELDSVKIVCPQLGEFVIVNETAKSTNWWE